MATTNKMAGQDFEGETPLFKQQGIGKSRHEESWLIWNVAFVESFMNYCGQPKDKEVGTRSNQNWILPKS